MPGVIRALSLAILKFLQVQSEHGFLGGGGGTVNTRSFTVTPASLLSSPGFTSSRWPTSTKAQVGWKAPVPQASRCVWL